MALTIVVHSNSVITWHFQPYLSNGNWQTKNKHDKDFKESIFATAKIFWKTPNENENLASFNRPNPVHHT
jgi:hypothetical protein